MIAACALGMQRLVVEECLKYVGYCPALVLSLIPGKVVKSAHRVRKASACPSSRQSQVSWNDFACRVLPELDRIGHSPDEPRNSPSRHGGQLPNLSYTDVLR